MTQQLVSDPMASQFASLQTQEAREALAQAERASEEGASRERVAHLSYIALRKAEIGLEQIQEEKAREDIARAEADRTAVLLAERTREAEAAKARAETARTAAVAHAEAAEAAQQQLAELRSSVETMEAKQTERGVILTLGDVLFDTDEATLKPAAIRTMDRLAEFLRENPETRLIVEGHADSRGPSAYNEQLSQRRAQAVAHALTVRGIDRDRFRTVGRGEAFPVANNATPAGRQENRRVEVVFSDNAGRFAEAAETSLR